jgi:transposase
MEKYNLKPSEQIFMQDNATCHTSNKSLKWLKDNNINLIIWPKNLPDLNSIENVWGSSFKKKFDAFQNKENLWKCIEEEWYKIPKQYIHKLYFLMCKRIKNLIKIKGNNTKY